MTCGYRPERHPWWRCLLEAGHWGWHRPVRLPDVTRLPCGCVLHITVERTQTWPCPAHTPPPPPPPRSTHYTPSPGTPVRKPATWAATRAAASAATVRRKHRKKEPSA